MADEAFVPRAHGDVVRFAVHVQPRASRSAIEGLHGGALKVRLNAPPVDGAANDALVVLLADALGVPRRAVRVIAGGSSRRKVVEVAGVDVTHVTRMAEEANARRGRA